MYAKVFRSMWDGTLADHWQAWCVFVFLLAHADREGFVDMTPTAIARRSGLPDDVVAEGLRVLVEPDPNSRTPEMEGIRLELIDQHRNWGWRIVNYLKFRSYVDAETVREQTRQRVRNHRAAKSGNAVKRTVTVGNAPKRYADADADADADEPDVVAGGAQQAAHPAWVATLPCKDGPSGIYGINAAMLDKWQRDFPDVRIGQELKAMEAWLAAKPRNQRKTVRGMPAFIARWLTGEQRKAANHSRAGADARYREGNQ